MVSFSLPHAAIYLYILAIIALIIVSPILELFRFMSGMSLNRACHKSIISYILLPDTAAARSHKSIGEKAISQGLKNSWKEGKLGRKKIYML